MIAWGTPLFLPTPPLPTMKHLYSSIACINTHPLLHFLKPQCLLFNQTGVFPLPVHHAFSCARDCDVLCTDLTTGVYSLVTIPSLRVTTVTRQLLQESPLPRLTRSPYFFFCLLAIIVLIITLCLYGHVARPKRDGKKDMMKLRLTGGPPYMPSQPRSLCDENPSQIHVTSEYYAPKLVGTWALVRYICEESRSRVRKLRSPGAETRGRSGVGRELRGWTDHSYPPKRALRRKCWVPTKYSSYGSNSQPRRAQVALPASRQDMRRQHTLI
ncbi:hypothetical protein FA13DRAFT_825574 [Coprinellus micaceus]|uniref:Uncharacterized protein n=1 Tax=Coprinellus micaceus TaxID=71717 RepID=A0A4Y7T234_COPMI|nr:hypothetical protein FA13DRAFT_825574 [Coprinellus micaceus]